MDLWGNMSRAKRADVGIWNLFVDESGQFKHSRDDVSFGGLMIQGDRASTSDRRIQRAIQRALPGLSWPLHTAHLNQPVFYACLLSQSDAVPADTRQTCRQACEWLSAAGYGLTRARAALREGRLPSIDELKKMAKALSHEQRQLSDELVTMMEDYHTRLRRVLRRFQTDLQGEMVALYAGEGAREAGAGAASDLRWLRMLEALMLRGRAWLGRYPHGHLHQVWVHCGTRHIDRPALGVSSPLTARDLQDLAARCSSAEVQFIMAPTLKNDPQAPAGFCIADWQANHSRRILRRDRALPAIEDQLSARAGLSVRTGGEGGRSHITAVSPLLRQWAITQAAEWGSEAGR